MDTHADRRLRSGITGAVVVGAHVIVVLIVMREMSPRDEKAESMVAVFTSLRWIDPVPEPEPRVHAELPMKATSAVRTESRTAAMASAREAPPPTAPTDWIRAAREAARGVAQADAPAARMFGQPRSLYRRCKERKTFDWDPEPGRGGFAGGIPYVRLGKRCAVGLGFFGCALGDLPKANGRLFDDMNAPDRDRNSVPQVGDCIQPDAAPR